MPAHRLPDHVIAARAAVYRQCVQEGFTEHGTRGRLGRQTAIAEAARRLGVQRESIVEAVHRSSAMQFEHQWTYPARINLDLRGATVMVAGDLHMWPIARVPLSPIKQAFRNLALDIKPDAIIFNGDLIDGTRISRHPALRGQNPPKLSEEIQAAGDYLLSLPAAAHQIITMSNHDVRVDNYVANQAQELDDIAPRLIDRLPGWKMAYAAVINGETEIRHETGRSGIHARHNNAKDYGLTIVTGHTHQLGVATIQTRRGTHYGIECGMLSHPEEPQFEYTWDRLTRWQPGFVVLTYDDDGVLLPPEKCEWVNGRPIFRGRTLDYDVPRYRVRAGSAAA